VAARSALRKVNIVFLGREPDSRTGSGSHLRNRLIRINVRKGWTVSDGGVNERNALMTDRTLREDIMNELDFEPRVNAAHIGVIVEKDVVTLSGHVASYAEKLAAEEAVRRVRGVRAIASEIEVRYPFDKKTADDEIAHRAIDILAWDATVPRGAVKITVQNGHVTLSGEVTWQFERKAAEDQIRKLSGVRAIINNIHVKPSIQPSDVKARIERALKRNAEVEARSIDVAVEGSTVSLNGLVHDWAERDAAEQAAWSVLGVTSVIDRLRIE
jgi:osmotically-inducible protein OsmY